MQKHLKHNFVFERESATADMSCARVSWREGPHAWERARAVQLLCTSFSSHRSSNNF